MAGSSWLLILLAWIIPNLSVGWKLWNNLVQGRFWILWKWLSNFKKVESTVSFESRNLIFVMLVLKISFIVIICLPKCHLRDSFLAKYFSVPPIPLHSFLTWLGAKNDHSALISKFFSFSCRHKFIKLYYFYISLHSHHWNSEYTQYVGSFV